MISRVLSTTVLAAAFVVGCASKPPTQPEIPAGASVETEIQQTERMIQEARQKQVDVLSPRNFSDAEKALAKAKEQQQNGKANEKVLEQVSYARGWLSEANAKSEISQTAMKDIAAARNDAGEAGAAKYFSKDWDKANRELEKVTTAIEKGDLSPAQKKGNELTSTYRDLEVQSVRKANLGIADENIQAAKKNGAESKAPKSFNLATMKYQKADSLITADPKNISAIRQASEDATRESNRLAEITRKVNAGNTEDLVLMSEKQRSTISSLRNEYSSTEEQLQASQQQLSSAERDRQALAARQQELQRVQGISKTADHLRKQFRPNEAEVYTEGGKLMIRLRGLQFASSKADLGPQNRALLQKVDTALQEINPKKITIEGHTDATGNTEKNIELSEKRAQAVEKFFVSNGAFEEGQVQAVGLGPDKPISDNKTPRGRAENRRIDLVVETN